MKQQPRLDRSEVVARLRALAARHGAVSPGLLEAQDREVARSLRLHFPSFAVACRAARVEVARPLPRAPSPSPRTVWSEAKVVDELQRLDGAGASTGWAELMESGQGGLVGAAAVYAGGLPQGRAEAGVEPPERHKPVPRWNAATIELEIRERARTGQPLASSKAPQRFVAAARWHFGSWEAALAAAGIEASETRLQRAPYTRAEIVELIRGMARDGTVVRPSTLKAVVKLDTVRKLFGSVAAAIAAAGIGQVPMHGNQKWSRERVIEELKALAARGETRLSRALQHAVQLHFGGAAVAREAAGLAPLVRAAWTAPALIKELQRRARSGEPSRGLSGACKRLFGSVDAARAAAELPEPPHPDGMAGWDGRALLAELRRRLRAGHQLGRGLTEGLRREFGSLAMARALVNRGVRGRGKVPVIGPPARRQRWTHAQVIERLQAWSAGGGGPLSKGLIHACKQQFGSVVRACAEANVPVAATAWTPRRIAHALRVPGVDVVDPTLVEACIRHFGSVTAARAAAIRRQGQRQWSKATLIAELQARARRGLKGVGRLLRDPAVRLFGSTEAALQAAAQTDPRSVPRTPNSARR